jgi:hypothetical protein
MILPGGLVEFLIINAHAPTSDRLLRNELILLIMDDSHSTFLRHHLYWTVTPSFLQGNKTLKNYLFK